MTSDYINNTDVSELVSRLPYEYRTIVRAAADTGFRIGDLCAARVSDYDVAENCITLAEDKTGKERTVECTDALALYCARRASVARDDNAPLFVNHLGRKFSRVSVWRWITSTWETMHPDDGRVISPHSMRKHYAVNRRLSGWSVYQIMLDLNHDRPSTTMLYAFADHLSEDEYRPTVL